MRVRVEIRVRMYLIRADLRRLRRLFLFFARRPAQTSADLL